MFLNILAKTVRDTISAFIPTWKDMKKEDIELILNRMEGSSSMISQMKAKSHHLMPSGWRNEYTQEKNAEMVTSRVEALTQTQSRAQSELGDGASSAESVVGPEQVDEFQIMSKALGTRSRWQKGLGAFPRLKIIGGQRAASMGQVTETIATLKQQLAEKDAEHARRIDETQRQMAEKEAENQCQLEETQRQLCWNNVL
ncbi:hypothetical protein PanWU01x14_142460 [Parasponia andersonii]|uniref:Uncharacterized protein n=1 Tax=Parasponia andersonii TaxID=3476 RepID=A0A2P5CLA5_PARAD|nr:hypothetical protein PanWU01x14_142460 [Parasponia andersonii]